MTTVRYLVKHPTKNGRQSSADALSTRKQKCTFFHLQNKREKLQCLTEIIDMKATRWQYEILGETSPDGMHLSTAESCRGFQKSICLSRRPSLQRPIENRHNYSVWYMLEFVFFTEIFPKSRACLGTDIYSLLERNAEKQTYYGAELLAV